MAKETTTQNRGLSVGGLLGCIFVTQKLCGVIDWSWWWVTAPFWGPLALIAVIAGVIFLSAVVIDLVEKRS